MKIKNILVSQPQPKVEKSPYSDLAKKNGLKIDFCPFIKVEGISAKEFRKQRISLNNYSAVIFTSKTAVDHYFRLCKELRIPISNNLKYFCLSKSVGFYLQKYIIYRKRKVFFGEQTIEQLIPFLKKHQTEKFLLPVSYVHKLLISRALKANKINFKKAVLYKTVSCDLSEIQTNIYDVIVFYTPYGVKSLLENFPNFEQNNTKIASFGKSTAKAIRDAGLKLDIKAPIPEAPSMTMALDKFISEFNKNGEAT